MRHRSTVALLLLALALAFTPSPGEAAGPPLGVVAGVSRSSLFDAGGWSAGAGYRAGVSVRKALRHNLWLEPEVAWAHRTTSATSEVVGQTLRTRVSADWLEVPVLVKRRLVGRRSFSPIVGGGIYYARNLRAQARTRIGDSSFDEPLDAELKRDDAGWVAGGGIELYRGTSTWAVEVRYLAGLVDLRHVRGADDRRTRSVSVSAGLRW